MIDGVLLVERHRPLAVLEHHDGAARCGDLGQRVEHRSRLADRLVVLEPLGEIVGRPCLQLHQVDLRGRHRPGVGRRPAARGGTDRAATGWAGRPPRLASRRPRQHFRMRLAVDGVERAAQLVGGLDAHGNQRQRDVVGDRRAGPKPLDRRPHDIIDALLRRGRIVVLDRFAIDLDLVLRAAGHRPGAADADRVDGLLCEIDVGDVGPGAAARIGAVTDLDHRRCISSSRPRCRSGSGLADRRS